MSEKLFKGIVYSILILGILSVIILVAYTYFLYKDSSIISYIGNGR